MKGVSVCDGWVEYEEISGFWYGFKISELQHATLTWTIEHAFYGR